MTAGGVSPGPARLWRARSTSAPAPSAVGVLEPDDLEAIEGIGPVFAARLRALGITTFAQITNLDPASAQRIEDDPSEHRRYVEVWHLLRPVEALR